MDDVSSDNTMWWFRLNTNDRGSGDDDDTWSGKREIK
jgi:hypothetical protein